MQRYDRQGKRMEMMSRVEIMHIMRHGIIKRRMNSNEIEKGMITSTRLGVGGIA